MQNFVAFSEYMNFKNREIQLNQQTIRCQVLADMIKIWSCLKFIKLYIRIKNSFHKQSEKACIICASNQDVLEFKLAQALFDEIKAPQNKSRWFCLQKETAFRIRSCRSCDHVMSNSDSRSLSAGSFSLLNLLMTICIVQGCQNLEGRRGPEGRSVNPVLIRG